MTSVVVRPFRPNERDEALAAWRRLGVGAGDRNARRRFLRRLERSGTFRGGVLDLAVEAEGRLVGDVQARRPRYALPSGAFELGIQIWDPADRGRGFGREAVAQVTDLLFAEHGAGRVQASTSVENAATRRLLESLGFVEEGVLRAFWPREDGSREDYVLYAVTRADWTARQVTALSAARPTRGGAATRRGARG